MGGSASGGSAPMRRDTLFRISSMSKPITAAATMILVEECKLRLDEPVDRLLPELADRRVLRRLDGPLDDTVPAHRPITLRDLLTFRMGFGQVLAPPDASPILKTAHELGIGMGPPAPDTMPAPDEWPRRLGSLPLMHQPGERWLYNTGSDVLGVLIARAAGQPFEAFLRERLFEPLGMRDTGFAVPAHERARLAACYTRGPGKRLLLEDDPEHSPWTHDVTLFSGGGGLVSTAHDYLRFCEMLRRDGALDGVRILSRKTIELMTANHLPGGQDLAQRALGAFAETRYEGQGFGLGFSVVLDRGRAATTASTGTYGWGGAASTIFWVDPQEEIVAIFLTQLIPSRTFDFRGQLQAIVYGALTDTQAPRERRAQ